jgi:hypothetical protein
MAPPKNPPLPGKVPPYDPARERLRQFEESRGMPPSVPDDPHEAPGEPAADDCDEEESPRPA